MVFRIPTQLDSFSSSNGQSVPRRSRPWRGSFLVPGLHPSDRGRADYIQVSAVETDGDNRSQLWPQEFTVQNLHRPLLQQVMHYVQQYAPPTCNFLPERLNPEYHETNRANFRALSRALSENNEVAIVRWNNQTGGGIIVYPATNSGAYLIGAIFYESDFPDFIRQIQPPSLLIPTSVGYPMGPPSAYGTHSAHFGHPQSSSPHHSHPSSPVDQPGSATSYRAIVPRTPVAHGAPYSAVPSGPSGSSPTGPGSYSNFQAQNPTFP
ncbi:hypothetical protein BKA70DRAFT_394775 [Coprinopsis sp. MPI-PUGE-AT-0042]|nr:hypothetical protein BKA70DRAFT_1120657 [Coprinopsis sp. MPI-PUGE-AT-0042]KAH6906624.1 hypothetical protein BKA70DRAFT_394775 [Coprinopsis sp. MPI-PUGE-AT-0042]